MEGVERVDTGHLSAEVRALVGDLRVVGEAAPESGARDRAGNPYRPTYYLRAVENAAAKDTVVERVRQWVHQPPTIGFNALVDADRPDLTVESLVLREGTPYRSLFTEEDRAAADLRLEPFRERRQEFEADDAARRERIEEIKRSGERLSLPELREGRRSRP